LTLSAMVPQQIVGCGKCEYITSDLFRPYFVSIS